MKGDKELSSFCSIVLITLIATPAWVGCKSEKSAPTILSESRLQHQHPSWLSERPFVHAPGNIEPLVFVVRRGHTASYYRNLEWKTGRIYPTAEENFQAACSEETVEREQELGSTAWSTLLHKAFGLEAESRSREEVKRLIPLLHKHGLKAGGYVGSSIAYETFLNEVPSAEEWLVPFEYWGNPVHYGTQTFRRLVYFAHPGYKEYTRKILRLGIDELKMDFLHFDNPTTQGRIEVFSHPLAVEHFREHLKVKYTREQRLDRFGFSTLNHIMPPPVTQTSAPQFFFDPLMQEWIDFRCTQLGEYYREMTGYARQLKPEIASIVNINNLSGTNKAFLNSIYPDRILPHTDLYFIEGGNAAAVTDDGRLISNIRDYKIARSYGNMALNWRGSPGGADYTPISVPEALAFNLNGALGPASMKEENWKYIDFLHQNFEHYRRASNIADVAILRSFASMAFNNFTTHQSTILVEQTLIQAKIPFDIIFDSHLGDLSKYKVLVLANQESLSNHQLKMIGDYIRDGGGVVATGLTSLFDEWRRRRATFGLGEMFGLEPPPIAARGVVPELVKDVKTKNEFGRGRVAYPSFVEPSIKRPEDRWMTNRYWSLPVAVRWAAGERLSAAISAPLTVAVEFQQQKELGKLIIHLVDYAAVRQPVVPDISISLVTPAEKRVQSILYLSPHMEKEMLLDFQHDEDEVEFSIPTLETYGIAVVQLERG
jgi:hypothetical protein